MLLSVLVSLTPLYDAPVLGPLGRPVQAWFLQQITRTQPKLGTCLHDQEGLKPYTVSTLFDGRGRFVTPGAWLEPGKEYWIRFTSLSPELSQALLRKVLPDLPARLSLYKMDFRINGWTLNPAQHPWAGQSSFDHLISNFNRQTITPQVRLEFCTPTAFRSDGADLPLPLPWHMLRSYWQKWNAFSPERLNILAEWLDFAREGVVVSELTGINTQRWSFAEGTRGVALGFTGTVGITVLAQGRHNEQDQDRNAAIQIMQTLAAFSFYCGTGHHTTIGMGQTRPLDPKRK